MNGLRSGTLTVDGQSIAVAVSMPDRHTVWAGWLPDGEGIDMSIIATEGKQVSVSVPGWGLCDGRIIHAWPDDCSVQIKVTS